MQPMTNNQTERFMRPLALADYLAIVRRRKWVIIVALILVPATAFAISLRQPAVYQASAEVLLSRQSLGAQVTGIDDSTVYQEPVRFAQTQADIARVPDVAQRVVEKVGGSTTAGELLAGSSVTPKANADLLVFTVSNHDRETAADLATAYAEAFTEYRSELDTRTLVRAQAQLGERLSDLRAEGEKDSALYASLVEKEQQLKTLALLQSSNTVVRPASGAFQIEPRPRRVAILGGLLGLVLGLGIAFLWETLDKRVRSEEEIEDVLGLPVLAKLAEPYGRLRRQRRLAVIHEPFSPQAESFRMLRTTVEFANLELDARTILVTSAIQREGKSTTVANLAAAFAQSGRRVVLVDLDLRQPSLASFFRRVSHPGLSTARSSGQPGVAEVVRGEATLDEALLTVTMPELELPQLSSARSERSANGHSPSAPSLKVLTAGVRLPGDPSQFVSSRALGDLLEQLRSQADLVLIDTPPVLAVGDAMMLSRQVDALLVVSRVESIPRPALQQLRRVLETTSIPNLGLILTGSSMAASYGYGPYGYRQSQGPSSRAPVSPGERR